MDPYCGKTGPDYFNNSKLIPPVIKSKFHDLVLFEKNRAHILDVVNEKRKIKEDLRTEEDVTQRLAVELQEIERKRLVEQKMRQRLRESNEELQELERKLRCAYISKALAAQLVEREALREAEKAQIRMENDIMEKALGKQDEVERMKAEKEHKKKMQFREGILEQVGYVQQKKARRYANFLREKELIDNIFRKIHEEHLEEMREKLSKKIAIRNDVKEFMRLQAEWKEKQRREEEEENRQIAKIAQQQIVDAEQVEREKQNRMKMKEEIRAAIAQRIYLEEEEKRKKMDLLLDLQVEEMKIKEDLKIKEDMEKKIRERITARVNLQQRQEEKNRRKQEEQEDEKRYREEQMRLMAEKDKLDQLSDERRRRKVLEHRRAIQQCLEERKRRRAKEFSIMVKEKELELQEEKRRQELIEEERIRMLKEHAADLLDYLPPGILKESDRQHLPLPPKK